MLIRIFNFYAEGCQTSKVQSVNDGRTVLPGVGCATNLILATLSGELKTSVGTENYFSPTGNAATKRYEFGLQN